MIIVLLLDTGDMAMSYWMKGIKVVQLVARKNVQEEEMHPNSIKSCNEKLFITLIED